MFTGLLSLKKLQIAGFKTLTRIISLPASLEHIELSNNAIRVIEPDAFRLLKELKHLNLNSNKLTAQTAFPAFAHLARLEHLKLRCNMIDSLEGLKAVRLPCLQALDLDMNNVTKLSKQTFATLPGLAMLKLSNNRISEIETGAFDGMFNLRVLYLDDNRLKAFYFYVFESAVNEICSPVNLMTFWLDAPLVRWSPETAALANDGTTRAKNEPEDDAAARLFAKCSFRNKLNFRFSVGYHTDFDRSFVDAIVASDLVRYI
jgi:hypothetical protein